MRKQLHPLTKPFTQFVAEGRSVHGEKYQYDENTYAGSRTPMSITCPLHGTFWQSPSSHIHRSDGCKECATAERVAKDRARSLPSVVARIQEHSGDTVEMVPETFTNINAPASFRCHVHGEFTRVVNPALYGSHPCPDCTHDTGRRGSRRHSQQQAEEMVRSRFGDRYEITAFEYQGKNETQVTMICPDHGEFTLMCGSLCTSSGCPRCSLEQAAPKRAASVRQTYIASREKRRREWIERARAMHGDRYDYSQVQFVSMRKFVMIGCPVHGFILQVPYTHVKSGCRQCADAELKGRYTEVYFERYPEERDRAATLYYIRISHRNESLYKVGITTTSIEKRHSAALGANARIDVLATMHTTLHQAYLLEQALLAEHGQRWRYRPPAGRSWMRRLRLGPSECFTQPLPREKAVEAFGSLTEF